ncbi:uncharacterized protein LOC120335939 [Styela clava]
MKAATTLLVIFITVLAVENTDAGWWGRAWNWTKKAIRHPITKAVVGIGVKAVSLWDNIRLLRDMDDFEFEQILQDVKQSLEADFGEIKTKPFLDMIVSARNLSDDEFFSLTEDDYRMVSNGMRKEDVEMMDSFNQMLEKLL